MSFVYDDKRGGVFCPKHNIAPWPMVIMRRTAVLDIMRSLTPGNYLEIGFGTGIFTYEFYRKGFKCKGYDIEPETVAIANSIFNQKEKIIEFCNELTPADENRYDCLGAFEVLEHNEDDAALIKQWAGLLNSNGKMLLSVPARMKKWSASDERGGHIRRYEKKDLIQLLSNAGLRVQKFYSVGFPTYTILAPLMRSLVHKPVLKTLRSLSSQERTQVSGIDRAQEAKFKKFIPFSLLRFLAKMQRVFYNTDLGEAYVVLAQKN